MPEVNSAHSTAPAARSSLQRPAFNSLSEFRTPHSRQLWFNQLMSTVSYLDRLLEPVTESLTPQLARTLVELRADDELQSEIDVLRQKANLGTLTEEENAAYKDFVQALDVLSIIQSKARRFLATHPA
jgi:hypothetical protein